MDKVRWGIIGPGRIAQEFAGDFQFSKHGQLIAVASRSELRSKQFADNYGIPRNYNAYDDLYNDPEVDAVYIATPHNFHFEQSVAALQAGKAVLCEKPLTPSLEQSRKLIDLSKSTGKYLMEGMWTYFLPAILRAKKWIHEDKIGSIRHIKASFGYPLAYDPEHRGYNPALAGGCLLDMGIYTLAITRLFLKESPLNVDVIARKAPTGVDDDVSMLLEYKDATASLATSFRVKLPNWAYLIGDRGTIAIPDFWRAKECLLYVGEKLVDRFSEQRKGFGFNFEIDAVSRDLLDGKTESEYVDHQTSIDFARMMDQVMKKF